MAHQHLQQNYPYEEENAPTYLTAFTGYLKRYHEKDIVDILLRDGPLLHYSIEVPHIDLLEDIPDVAYIIFSSPVRMFPIFDTAILECQEDIMQGHEERTSMTKKPNCHIRIFGFNFQNSDGITMYNLPRSNDVGILLEVKGTVIRTAIAKTLEYKREYQCTKCKEVSSVEVQLEQMYQFPKPPPCKKQVGQDRRCGNRNFKPVPKSAACKDYQEIKIQEHVHKLGMGSIPRSMLLILQDDLVDKCQAGDDITVSGIVVRRWRPVKEEERCDMEVVLVVNHVRVNNEQRFGISMTDELKTEFEEFWKLYEHEPLRGRNIILSNICAGVHGMFVVKLAVALTIIGGVARVDPTNGSRTRGECHMLMVGEPGTGKSQFLRYASKLGSRCVLTTGIGTTSAGLTVTAVKEQGGEWVLEAGALVLADGGVCCIDEFSSIRTQDRAAIHEAMEQQTLSVAKAGLICKLHTRTTVLAATNAKGKYDPEKSISINTTLASPLLSRFDIVLVLLDENNAEWDSSVADFILKGHAGNGYESEWPMEKVQAYFSYIKTTFQPALQPAAKLILGEYYRSQRRQDGKHAARTTIRLLESLIRIAQAHARLMSRHTVETQDAVVAVVLMEASITNSPLFEFKNPLHSMFPENPDEDYMQLESKVIQMLGLEDHMTSDSQLSAHARADRDELFGFQRGNQSWMRVRPDVGRGQTAQPQDDEEEWQHRDYEEEDPAKYQNHDEELDRKPDPPPQTANSPKKNTTPHQNGNTDHPPKPTPHNTSQQNNTAQTATPQIPTPNQRNTSTLPHQNVTNNQRALPNDDPDDYADLLNDVDDSQPAQQPNKPPAVPPPQQQKSTPLSNHTTDSKANNNNNRSFDMDEDIDFGDNDQEATIASKVPIPSSASTYDSKQSTPVRSIPSTPIPSTPSNPQGSVPQNKQASNAQPPKSNTYSYNDEEDYLDSLQVEDEDVSVAIPSSVTPPSSFDAKKYAFLNDDDDLDLHNTSKLPPSKAPTNASNNNKSYNTNDNTNAKFTVPTNTKPSHTTNPHAAPTPSNNKRKAETDEWEDYSFLDDVDDTSPPPTSTTTIKKGGESSFQANKPTVDDEEDIPIAALTKKKKFVE